jgi:hypothetical protein
MASVACASSSHSSTTHSGDYNGARRRNDGTGPDLLPTRGACQENSMRDWLIPLNLDTNHGYAKEQVVNSELAKRKARVGEASAASATPGAG